MEFKKNVTYNLAGRQADVWLLIVLCVLAGGVSLFLGQDMGVDVQYYHLYNGFAFVTGRFGKDIMPANIHTFLNPLPEVPYYLLFRYLNNYPRLVTFLFGLPGGVLSFFVYKICRLFLWENGHKFATVLAVAIGISGTMTVTQTGYSSNEVPLAAILCASFYLLLKFLLQNQKTTWLFGAAFLTGAAAGMKYTAGSFVIGLTIAFLVNKKWIPDFWKKFAWFALGGASGFLVTNGYFMLRLWITYGNPFFPFLNGIFKSPFFDPVNFDETRFYPRSLGQWLFYPFYWIQKNHLLVTDRRIFFADARFALGYIGAFWLVMRLAMGKFWKRYSDPTLQRRQIVTLLAFVIGSYIVWIKMYSILRYTVPLEVLSGLLILLAISVWGSKKFVIIGGVVILAGLACCTHYPDWQRRSVGEKLVFLSQRLPIIKQNALIIYYEEGLAFLSMLLPADAQFIGGIKLPVNDYEKSLQRFAKQRNPLPKPYYNYHFKEVIKAKIARHQGSIYIIMTPWPGMLYPMTLNPYGLTFSHGKCWSFNANINIYSSHFAICEVEKLSSPVAQEPL